MNIGWLNFKLEDLANNYILAYDPPEPPWNIYKLAQACAENEEISEPYIGITAAEARPAFEEVDQRAMIGNRSIELKIMISTHAERDTANNQGNVSARERHEEIVSRIFNLFCMSDLVNRMNKMNYPGIEIVQIDLPVDVTVPAKRSYITTISLKVHCCTK